MHGSGETNDHDLVSLDSIKHFARRPDKSPFGRFLFMSSFRGDMPEIYASREKIMTWGMCPWRDEMGK